MKIGMGTLSFSAEDLRAYHSLWSARRRRRKPWMLRPLRIGISAKGAFFSFSSMTGNLSSLSPHTLSAETFGRTCYESDAVEIADERPPVSMCLYSLSQSANAPGSVSVVCRQLNAVSSDDNRQQLSAMLASSNQTSSICAPAGCAPSRT